MAKELAAMAKTPSGATMTVVRICAPQMTTCSIPIGKPIRSAFLNVSAFSRKWLSRMWQLSFSERVSRYQSNTLATTVSAAAVPRAAPLTPSPAPGIVNCMPAMLHPRVGKIRKKLNTTSSTHMMTPNKLGMRIFPLQRSMPPARKIICRTGRKIENMKK